MPELNSITDPASRRFIERLSCLLIVFSAFGALFVLVDPVLTLQLGNGHSIKIGGEGFDDQMKGAVLMLILVAGFTAVVQYWLGASNTGDKAQENVNAIAAAAAPAQAAAVAAATGTGSGLPTPAGTVTTMNVAAENVEVTEKDTKP